MTGLAAATTARGQRIAGALLGVHSGDSLGATVEFASWEQIHARYPTGLRDIIGGGPFDWPAGHATDDTDLTRAVLLAYLDRRVDPDLDVVTRAADHMLAWADGNWPGRDPGQPPSDIGNATHAGLSRYRRNRDATSSGAGPGQAGNGSLMRCIPTALVGLTADRRRDEATRISAITHDDPRCTIACAAYVEIAAALLDGASPTGAVNTGLLCAQSLAAGQAHGRDVVAAIDTASHLSTAPMAGLGEIAVVGEGSGFVLNALMISVAAVLDPRPLEDVLVDVVRIGNDTDTNAAIAGGLLGARDGLSAIPERWLAVLQFRDEFLAAAATIDTGP